MINAKDTFYIMLRNRLAALNPARTMDVRGMSRPGVLVDENELATGDMVPDVFHLRWMALSVATQGPLPLATMSCEIRYATAGNSGNGGNGGMDRGRMLTQMDSEFSAVLRMKPHNAVKMNYASSGFGVAPVAMATHVFWSDAVFAPTVLAAEQLQRTVAVEVFCFQEVGE